MPESARRRIGRITLDAKLPGKRRTGNPSAPFEVAGVGDGLTATLHGHEAGNGGYRQGEPTGYRANPRPDRWRPRPDAQRTESTPRVRPSGAASQLDPSHRSDRFLRQVPRLAKERTPCCESPECSSSATPTKQPTSATRRRMVREAAARGARIACLPELFNTMYFCVETRPEYFDWAEPIPGPTTERMGALAGELGIVLIAPVFEKAPDGRYFNAAAVLGPDGRFIGKYRKSSIPFMDASRSCGAPRQREVLLHPGRPRLPHLRHAIRPHRDPDLLRPPLPRSRARARPRRRRDRLRAHRDHADDPVPLGRGAARPRHRQCVLRVRRQQGGRGRRGFEARPPRQQHDREPEGRGAGRGQRHRRRYRAGRRRPVRASRAARALRATTATSAPTSTVPS